MPSAARLSNLVTRHRTPLASCRPIALVDAADRRLDARTPAAEWQRTHTENHVTTTVPELFH